ncbi:integrase core domain-containing protein, partial [Gluconobacter japonicus]|uniref:integrase core domain-containing protein n=1 Tax=Gluconobacter japonicus TaxID=376620 RepID=UPI001F26856F
HPWTNGQVERMNRTIREATVKRFHYGSHEQLRTHPNDFMGAYNLARRLKTRSGVTPHEYVCKIWTSDSERSIINLNHQTRDQTPKIIQKLFIPYQGIGNFL